VEVARSKKKEKMVACALRLCHGSDDLFAFDYVSEIVGT
jgi:hypothetical protein